MNMISKSLAKKIAVLSLLSSLLIITTSCVAENSSDTSSTEVNQTTEIRNGEVKLNCSSNSPDAQVTSTAIVNGREYRCENGRTVRVR